MRSYIRELLKGLLAHERPHWQAINESARPLRILNLNTVPKPCEHDGSGFAETGWDIYELRAAGRARIVPRQTGLVVVGRVARGRLKKGVEQNPAHDSPPSRRVDAKCLVIDCIFSQPRAKVESTLHPSSAESNVCYQIPMPYASKKITLIYGLFSRFGWDVGGGRRSDSEGGGTRPEEIAEYPSQAHNGSDGLTKRTRADGLSARAGCLGRERVPVITRKRTGFTSNDCWR